MQAILDLAAERNLEDKEEILDKMMEMGQYVHIDVRHISILSLTCTVEPLY